MKTLNYIARVSLATALALFAVIAISDKAHAADPFGPYVPQQVQGNDDFSWTGLYIGGNVGYQVGDTGLNLEKWHTPAEPAEPELWDNLSANGFSSADWRYGLRGGFDYQPKNTPFVIGAFAGYDWGEMDFSFNQFNKLTARGTKQSLDGSIEPTWHVGIRVGITPTERSLIYVGYAYGEADFSIQHNHKYGSGNADRFQRSFNQSSTVAGHTFLAGVELAVTDSISTSLEYNYTQYEDVSFTAPVFNAKADEVRTDYAQRFTAEPDVHAVMLRLNWRPKLGLF